MEILILGGTGFVSKSLAKYLISRGYSIDILTRGKREVDYTGFKNHIKCDRHNSLELKEALKDKSYDVVFDISGYTKDDVKIFLDAIDKSSLKRYIFCSSGAVYMPSDDILVEASPKGENSSWGKYGYDKLEAENYIFDLINKSQIHATIFRPSYIYGKGNNLPRESYFFNKIENGESIKVPAGNTKVQFIHIDDLTKIFECAIYNDNDNRAYNVSSPNAITFLELLKCCEDAVGKKAIIEIEEDLTISSRDYFPFRNKSFLMNITDLRENGFHLPVIYLEEGLEMTYRN